MATKDRIVIGDTYRVAFQSVRKSDNERIHVKQPVIPDAAKVSLWDVILAAQVPLGASGEVEVDATITDNRIEYLIPAIKFASEGDYKVYVTAYFTTTSGMEKITNVKQVRVMAKQ